MENPDLYWEKSLKIRLVIFNSYVKLPEGKHKKWSVGPDRNGGCNGNRMGLGMNRVSDGMGMGFEVINSWIQPDLTLNAPDLYRPIQMVSFQCQLLSKPERSHTNLARVRLCRLSKCRL